MPTIRRPRKGSLQYWPRKHAKRTYPRIKHYAKSSESKLSGFAGYKAGMTRIFLTDNRANSITKGKSIMWPVTILECPPVRVVSIRFYKKTSTGLKASKEFFITKDKFASKKINLPKKETQNDTISSEGYDDIRVNVVTQPHLAGIGKKRPEIFELAIGGKDANEKLTFAKSIIGKEVKAADVFTEGQQIDIFSVTKGKGTQGPVKRFGVGLRRHKSEKGRRGPANVGPWKGNRSWTVAHAGRMGFHNRLEKNKWLLKISEDIANVNAKGGFINYGLVKGTYILLKGSLPGPKKRLIRLVPAFHPNKHVPSQAPSIESVSVDSQQR